MLPVHRDVHKHIQGCKQLQSTGDNDLGSSSSPVFLNRSNCSTTHRCAIESHPRTFNHISWGYLQRRTLPLYFSMPLYFCWLILHHYASTDRFTFFSPKIHNKTFLARSRDIDTVLFFLKSCSSEATFPALTIFIPVERSPSMDCITSERAGFMTQSRVSFILRAGWTTEKDGFTYRASRRGTVSPILESAETWQGATSPGKPFSGVSERGL